MTTGTWNRLAWSRAGTGLWALAIFAICLGAASSVAHGQVGLGQVVFEGLSFTSQEFSEHMSVKIDDAIAARQKIIDNPASSSAEREQAQRWITGFKKMRIWTNTPKETAEFLNLLRQGRDDIQNIVRVFGNGSGINWNTQSISPLEMDLSSWSKGIRGMDLGMKTYRLVKDFEQIESYEYDGPIQSTVKWLKVVSFLGSEFVKDTPGLENSAIIAILKGYADLLGEAVNTVNRLNSAMERVDQGHLGEGAHRMGSAQQRAWQQQGLSGTIVRVPGFRDLYEDVADGGQLYLWDKDSQVDVTHGAYAGQKRTGRWWDLRKEFPEAGREEFRRRYLTMYRAGNQNPSAQDILLGFRKLVWLNPVILNPGVVPGGILKVRPTVIRLFDRQEAKGIYCNLRDPSQPSKVMQVRSGEEVEWVAATRPGTQRLILELQPEVTASWTAADKGEATYWVGGPTSVRLSVRPRVLRTDSTDPVDLLVTVKGDDDRFVDEGFIVLRTDPVSYGFEPRSTFSGGQNARDAGIRLQWQPPGVLARGPMLLVAEYEGTRKLSDGEYLVPSRDTVQLAIFEPVVPDLRKIVAGGASGREFAAVALDGRGKSIQEGTLRFECTSGTLTASGQRGTRIEVPCGKGETVSWFPTAAAGSGSGSPGDLKVTFLEHQSQNTFFWYQTATRTIALPGVSQGSTASSKSSESTEIAKKSDSGERKPTDDESSSSKTQDEAQGNGPPLPKIRWDLQFGASSFRESVEPKMPADTPETVAPPAPPTETISFDEEKRTNANLPKAPKASGTEMGDEGRPDASNPKRPSLSWFSDKIVDLNLIRQANRRKPGGGACWGGEPGGNYEVVDHYSGEVLFGRTCRHNGRLVSEQSLYKGDRHGPSTLYTSVNGRDLQCVGYYDVATIKAARVILDGTPVLEVIPAGKGEGVVRYTEIDMGHRPADGTSHGKGSMQGLVHTGTYQDQALLSPDNLCQMVKRHLTLPDGERTEKGPSLYADFRNFGGDPPRPPVSRGVGLAQIWQSGSGPLRYEAWFQDGNVRWDRAYHLDGSWHIESTYNEKGELHGWRRTAYPGAIPREEQAWREGKRHGTGRFWDPDGVLIRETQWKEDELAHEAFFVPGSEALGKLDAATQLLIQGQATQYREEASPYKTVEYDPPGTPVRRMLFFADGTCHSYSTYQNGELHGMSWTFHPSGRMRHASKYVSGVKEGYELTFRDDGRVLLQRRVHYRDGKKDGEELEMSADGRVVKRTQWRQDQRDGVETEYDEATGRRIRQARYQQDAKTEEKGFDPVTGVQVLESSFRNGSKHGEEKRFHSNGQIAEVTRYNEGTIQGEQKGYDAQGRLVRVTPYVGGLKQGTEQFRSASANRVREEVSWVNGKQDGPRRLYDWREGTLLVEESFRQGNRHGRQRYYREGELVRDELYENGQRVK
jgi:antitoxin component YwqK of YwqJK toxin-antitoxin module